MAMGLPVVGTREAFQGLQATSTDGIRIANDPQHFAKEVMALLANQDLQRRCSQQARQYVRRSYRWQDHSARLESVLEAVG
jgi:glycosyltransferase involved in cell wall biosynthesis